MAAINSGVHAGVHGAAMTPGTSQVADAGERAVARDYA